MIDVFRVSRRVCHDEAEATSLSHLHLLHRSRSTRCGMWGGKLTLAGRRLSLAPTPPLPPPERPAAPASSIGPSRSAPACARPNPDRALSPMKAIVSAPHPSGYHIHLLQLSEHKCNPLAHSAYHPAFLPSCSHQQQQRRPHQS